MGRPLPDGMVHVQVMVAPSTAAVTVGASGLPKGVTVLDAGLASPQPTSLHARTRNEYAVPLVSPPTVSDTAAPAPTPGGPATAAKAPLLVGTSQREMGAPLKSGAPRLKVPERSPSPAVGTPGADGRA